MGHSLQECIDNNTQQFLQRTQFTNIKVVSIFGTWDLGTQVVHFQLISMSGEQIGSFTLQTPCTILQLSEHLCSTPVLGKGYLIAADGSVLPHSRWYMSRHHTQFHFTSCRRTMRSIALHATCQSLDAESCISKNKQCLMLSPHSSSTGYSHIQLPSSAGTCHL